MGRTECEGIDLGREVGKGVVEIVHGEILFAYCVNLSCLLYFESLSSGIAGFKKGMLVARFELRSKIER